MPEGTNRVAKAREAAASVLRAQFPEQWGAIEQGLVKLMKDAKGTDLWLDAIGYSGHLDKPKLAGLAVLLADVGRGAVDPSAGREGLMQYRISGTPDFQQGVVQTPGLQQAMQQWEAGGVPREGPLAAAYDRQMGQGGERFQELQQQGLLGPPAQPQVQGSPLAQPQGAGQPTMQDRLRARSGLLDTLLADQQ